MSKKTGFRGDPAKQREKVVRLIVEHGYSLKEVAEQFGCSQESVRRWKEANTRKLDPELAQRMEREEDVGRGT